MSTFLPGALLSRMCSVTGATQPDIRLPRASYESVTTRCMDVLVRATARAMASSPFAVARGVEALVRYSGPSVTTATMSRLPLSLAASFWGFASTPYLGAFVLASIRP